MSKGYRVNEIFYSLQGEGYHTGMPAVFVRFSGCNLRCPWCDTDFASFQPMSAEEIIEAVQRTMYEARCHMVVLTGGEPSLQADKSLIDALHEAGFYICIETNGTHPLPEGIDWVTCSPKEIRGTDVRCTKADEVKVVYTGEYDPNIWREKITANHWFLQPLETNGSTNHKATIQYILTHPTWRLSLQTHKMLGIR